MKIVRRLVLFAVLVALGVWLWTILFPSPERIIRRRLADLARTASFTGKEGLIVRAASINKLVDFFAKEIEITVNIPNFEEHHIAGRDEITMSAQAAPTLFGSLQIEFLDPTVTLSADKESAVVNLTLRAKIPRDNNFIVQEMKFTLKKIGKEWLIIRIETVRTLSAVAPDGFEDSNSVVIAERQRLHRPALGNFAEVKNQEAVEKLPDGAGLRGGGPEVAKIFP